MTVSPSSDGSCFILFSPGRIRRKKLERRVEEKGEMLDEKTLGVC
jgi:hypothetical protein